MPIVRVDMEIPFEYPVLRDVGLCSVRFVQTTASSMLSSWSRLVRTVHLPKLCCLPPLSISCSYSPHHSHIALLAPPLLIRFDSDLTFRHRASSIQDRCFATLQRTFFYIFNQQIYFII